MDRSRDVEVFLSVGASHFRKLPVYLAGVLTKFYFLRPVYAL